MKKRTIKSPRPLESTDALRTIRCIVNGEDVERDVSVRMLLTDFLRHELGLTGTHVGCEHGVCGCCTIIMNEVAVRSCLCFAVHADGAELRTVESLADEDGTLHPVQQAFHDNHALQCGYCTPGFLMSIVNYLEQTEELDLSDNGIREVLSGNLCRCTGYQNIVSAFLQAAESIRGRKL